MFYPTHDYVLFTFSVPSCACIHRAPGRACVSCIVCPRAVLGLPPPCYLSQAQRLSRELAQMELRDPEYYVRKATTPRDLGFGLG